MRIAHVSDAHLLADEDERAGLSANGLKMRYLSVGRALEPAARADKLRRALDVARAADHVVVSGDLTELGTDAQLARLAEVLLASGVEPRRVTLVPGNHDAYASQHAWKNAMRGVLAPWAESSAGGSGKVVERDEVSFLPIDVSRHQAFALSSGALRDDDAERLEARLADAALQKKPIVIVTHHPPYSPGPLWRLIDGMAKGARMMSMLERFANVSVLHGHLHRLVDRILSPTKSAIFGASAAVDGGATAVRFYDVIAGALVCAPMPPGIVPR